MDAIRKQLDALMGPNRNGDVHEVKRKYYDRDVCRLYLCGLCPHDLFQLTKMDLGPCPRIHSLQLRREYEESKTKGRDNFDRELEDALERHILECDRKIARSLKRLEDDDAGAATAIVVSEVIKSEESDKLTNEISEKMKEAEQLELEGKTDERLRLVEEIEIMRQKRADVQSVSLLEAFNKDRLNNPLMVGAMGHHGLMGHPVSLPPLPPSLPLPPPSDPRTQDMIKEKLKKAEELGEEGNVDEAQKLMEEVEALKRLGVREVIHSTQGINIQITDQKLRVCDICGAFLSIFDSDRRLADHLGGKLHLGYMQIREKLKILRESRMQPRKIIPDEKIEKSKSDDQGKESSEKVKEGSKERDRDRDRKPKDEDRDRKPKDEDRDRKPRDGDRDRDRNRNQDRDRNHDRDQVRDRNQDRDRGYRREKGKETGDSRSRRRSRSRSRSRDHDRHRTRDDRHKR